jgi:hypothetical protein
VTTEADFREHPLSRFMTSASFEKAEVILAKSGLLAKSSSEF